ncbi:MAG TPA: 50S ribosomal protein L19 [Spirochaetia bacterium]|nr:50S ribosomal protein L19 [Spirochaetia bacterium]
MNNIIKQIEASRLKGDLPGVKIGDTVDVKSKIIEGGKERLQSFKGVVIGMKNTGVNKMVKVRKISFGVGVEKTFLLHSPLVASVAVMKSEKPRRAKLYYLRKRIGKSALAV